MRCSKCEHDNRTGAKFCEECGYAACALLHNLRDPNLARGQILPQVRSPGWTYSRNVDHLAFPSRAIRRRTSPKRSSPLRLSWRLSASRARCRLPGLKGSIKLLADRDPEEAR